MARLFGIAGIQMSVTPWDADANIQKVARVANSIGRGFPWVQMIVFHELAVPGDVQFDVDPTREQLERLYQPVPGEISDSLCEIARRERLWLVPGSLYERDGDKIFNTAIAISPQGELVAKYRKLFPWYPYESAITAGKDFCVFDVPGVGRFGLSICYDMWFPETIRTLAWMGAEVILHPTLTTTVDRELELVLSQASAITNQCYFLDVNGVGPWGGGSSQLTDPDGRVVQRANQHDTIMTELLDLDRVTRAREYGTLGLAQTFKQLRESEVAFPPYIGDVGRGEVFKGLDRVRLHKRIE